MTTSQLLYRQPHEPTGNTGKRWWAPMWRGLVADPTAKHYKAIRGAIWVYLYLLLHADRRTGVLWRRVSTISEHTGIKPRTVRYGLARLRQAGYITAHNSGRALTIQIQKWKPLQGQPRPPASHTHDRSHQTQQLVSILRQRIT